MQNVRNRKRLSVRLIVLMMCAFLIPGCALWSDLSATFKTDRTPSENDIEAFTGTLRPIKGNAESVYRLAVHYQKRGKHHWAIEEFKKVIAIDPRHARAYNAVGVSLDNLENYAAAQKAYLRALKIDGQLDYVWNNLGYSAMLQGHPEEAAAYYQKALAQNADNPRYRNNLLLAKAQLPADIPPVVEETPVAAVQTETIETPNDTTPQDQIAPKTIASPDRKIADQLPQGPQKIASRETTHHGFSENRMITLTPAAGSKNPSAKDIPEQADRQNESPPAQEKQETVSVATTTSPEPTGTTGTLRRVADISEEPARPVKPFNVVSTLVKIATGYTIKLSDDLRQIVHASPNDGSDKPKEKSRVVIVQTAGSQRNGFRFTVKPVLRVRAQPAVNPVSPSVLALPSPGVRPDDSPLKAASISTRLQVPRQLDEKIADAQGPYVKVVNGNGVNGMAGRIGRYLARRGFPVGHAANADHFNHRHTVLYFPEGYLHEAWEVAKAIPGYQEMKKTVAIRNSRIKITLLIGRDVAQYQDMFHKG
ncbi:MAG: tetratricopeptide repeat protein [Desulfosarcina sp.]|nr:tetratricopeptide repeat protein [Desulfobacterales bacterium]